MTMIDIESLSVRMMLLVKGRPCNLRRHPSQEFDYLFRVSHEDGRHWVELNLTESDMEMSDADFTKRFIIPSLDWLDNDAYPDRRKAVVAETEKYLEKMKADREKLKAESLA